MIHTDSNDFRYFESLEEIKQDGFSPIQVKSLLEFFTLRGKSTLLKKENLVPIPGLQYVVFNGENRYYIKEFRGYTIDELYFYNKYRIDFSDLSGNPIENLRRYVYDDRVFLMLSPENIEQTKQMLARIYSSVLKGEGTLSYRLFHQILEASIKLEDYQEWSKNDTGFKTKCKIQSDYIAGLWKKAHRGQNKPAETRSPQER